MYSRKSVGPRMDPYGTPALSGNTCEDFPSRTTSSRLLLRKKRIRPNLSPEIPLRLKFVKNTSMPSLPKVTNHRKKTSRVVVFSSRPFPKILKDRDY